MRPESSVPSEELSAYIDGELSQEENVAIELRLVENEPDQMDLAEFRGLVSLLGKLPQYETPRSFLLSADHIRASSPPMGILRFLPVVRSLTVAAVVAFLVVTAIVVYDRVESTNDPNDSANVSQIGTDAPVDASKQSTGDTAPEGSGPFDRGDSAASNAVPPEASDAPGSSAAAPEQSDTAQLESTPAATEISPDETPVSVATTSQSDDDDNRWLMTSAGLGVLASVLIALWVVLLRTQRGQIRSAWQAPDFNDAS